MEPTTRTTTQDSISTLNSFLRGELSAVETYRSALERLKDAPVRVQLEECYRSHQQRVQRLRQRIVQLGGTPTDGSGIWGTFAKLVQGGANILGEHTAIAALEEGEDHGRDDYRRDIEKLDPDTRRFIETEILPEQKRTHDMLSAIKKTVH